MQLVAYGAQDVYLSGNPQITFFKVVYRRHTNFSVEPIQQTWNGAGDFGRSVTCNINRNGDLITNMYVVVSLKNVDAVESDYWGYVRRLGHAMIDYCKIEIGGSLIDQHYGDWLNVWYELTHKIGQERGYAKMIGDVPELTSINNKGKKPYTLYIPLIFWFNRNNGLALPLIALQYHDVRITLKFRDAETIVNFNGSTLPRLPTLMADTYLLIDYVYLDSEERKRFAQASHEYLIEQLQFTGSESLASVSNKYRLNFNHPCKYLIWAPHLERYNTRSNWIAYTTANEWASVADRFAKLMYIACADGLSIINTAAAGSVAASISVEVQPGASTAAGDLFEPLPHATTIASRALTALLKKFEVKLVRQNAAGAGAGAPGPARIATSQTSGTILQELLNNSVVLNNTLTMEDISKTTNMLKDLLTSADSKTILDYANIQVIDYSNYGNFLDGSDNPVVNGKLQLNGHDRFQARDGYYFNYVQPLQHFSNTPADGINVYSFALKAEDHQPSGTCNFSRIDNATLQVDCGTYNSTAQNYIAEYIGKDSNSLINIYTMNYNVLRVMSGMAGTAYSN